MDRSSNRSYGKMGEKLAADFLSPNGYESVCMNYFASHNEIDIIVKDEKYIVFTEFKTRTDISYSLSKYGRPAAAVNYRKRQSLLAAAQDYLLKTDRCYSPV
jgi:Holliday junction resolvase-like predicted endonuclease